MPGLSEATPAALARLAPDASGLLPRGVLVKAGPVRDLLGELHPAERALVARAVTKRQHEFATARSLARSLLATLGAPEFSLLSDSDRAPVWPAGIVGSISHSHGVCMVAAARRADFAGLGVDIEDEAGVRPELWSRVLRAEEERWLRAQPDAQRLPLAAVFFSAKEAVYKAQFPLTRARLGFQDVALELDPARCAFRARVPGFARPLEGAFSRQSPWVLTALALSVGYVSA